MSEAIVEATDENFDKIVVGEKGPMVIDFWASWCGPCMSFKPTMEKIAEDMKDKIKVVMVEVDRSPQAAGKFNVMSVPTIIILKDGQVKGQYTGALSEKDLKTKIEDAIK